MVVQNHNAILKQSKGIQQLEVRLHSFAKSHQDRRHRQQSLIPTQSWCNPYAIPRNGRTRPPESIEQAGVQGGFVLPLRGDCESQIGKDIRARNRTAKRRQSTTIRKAITPQNASQLHEPTHISAKGHRIPAILIIHMQSAIMLQSQRTALPTCRSIQNWRRQDYTANVPGPLNATCSTFLAIPKILVQSFYNRRTRPPESIEQGPGPGRSRSPIAKGLREPNPDTVTVPQGLAQYRISPQFHCNP